MDVLHKLNLLKKSSTYRLTFFSLLYLLLPNLIFVAGWFRWELALVVLLILLGSFYLVLSDFHRKFNGIKEDNLSFRVHLLVVAVAVVVCAVSGIGGFTFQGDQDKHYGVLRDLIVQPWPVVYQENFLVESAVHLNYYLAYYLPVALLAKLVGIAWADALMFLWTFFGVYSVLRWVLLWKGKNLPLIAMLIFLFFGGQDFLYALFKIPVKWVLLGDLIPFHVFREEIAAEAVVHNNMLQFYAPIVSMTWCPQHVLGGWLAAALIFHQFSQLKSLKSAAFIVSLTFIWSVFNSIGLTIILLMLLFKKGFLSFISFQNLLGALSLTVLVAFFFQAHYSIAESGWIWEAIPGKSWLPKIFVFLMIEFGIYAWLSYRFVKNQDWKLIWWAAIAVLFVIPFYVVGYFNDFLMRAAVPSLFIISIVFIQYFSALNYKYKYHLLFVFLFFANIPYFTLRYIVKDRVEDQNNVANSPSVTKLREAAWFNAQYLGRNESVYWLYLSAKQKILLDESEEAIQLRQTEKKP